CAADDYGYYYTFHPHW
nr:immunoglobulin heavy chain junction region [Macaca mulatta]MOY21820.1 immunoglobulin heavy chain junction region [Macaca mulatta]MOY23981.1 immunoglobulin heavy chain junction region [Macaca mulatta]MOY24306.1 immunoglobulin heavy chain junction region [Macaca mulatta]MOY25239.1 immunoglobulin heavy chain junction region [Macaca mulatta]